MARPTLLILITAGRATEHSSLALKRKTWDSHTFATLGSNILIPLSKSRLVGRELFATNTAV